MKAQMGERGRVMRLDGGLLICSVIVYVENRIKTDIDYSELAKETGFSLAHIRALFAKRTGITLSRYVLERRTANAAFEVSHTKESLLAISERYGFKSADTFTRAFRRVAGITPSEFRKREIAVGRIKLCMGAYGAGFTGNEIENRRGNESHE